MNERMNPRMNGKFLGVGYFHTQNFLIFLKLKINCYQNGAPILEALQGVSVNHHINGATV